MVTGEFNGGGSDGSFAEVPWASVFDPDINMRAVGAVQERGFRAATEVVNRLVRMTARVAEVASGTTAENAGDAADPDAEKPSFDSRADADRVMKLWQGMATQLSGSLLGAATSVPGAPADGALFDLINEVSQGQIHLSAGEPGPVSGEVWLHNRSPEDLGKVRLRCSDLLAHDGAVVPANSVRFEPDAAVLPARSSRGVLIEVDVDADLRPGTYRGTLLADGHENVWLPVVLVVRAGDS